MSSWAELLSVALLGTSRRAPPVLADPELGDLAPGASPEERLLTAAGALTVYRRAGKVPPAAPTLPEPAPQEAVPVCGPAATSRLAVLLDDQRALIPEWLRAVADRGLRAPSERLPDLLEVAIQHQALRAEVEAVLGERGRWLAAQQPRWGFAAPLPTDEEEREALWLAGERPQRRRLFALLRRERPAHARDLLEVAWSGEPPDDRAWFLGALAEGLCMDDESLIERALDDPRREVRDRAAGLLSRLPGSAFARRMRDLTVPLVRVVTGVRKHLQVELPENHDDAMARDGIVRKAPKGLGERAWWLEQLVASTPLGSWKDVGLDANQAASLPVNDGLEKPLRNGFARAAEEQRDSVWATAFLDLEPQLIEIVDPDQASRLAGERLREGETDVAERLPAPWSRVLSKDALEVLVETVRGGGDRRRPRLLAQRLDPGLTDDLAKRLEDLEPGSANARLAEEILALMTFRRAMHEELQ